MWRAEKQREVIRSADKRDRSNGTISSKIVRRSYQINPNFLGTFNSLLSGIVARILQKKWQTTTHQQLIELASAGIKDGIFQEIWMSKWLGNSNLQLA